MTGTLYINQFCGSGALRCVICAFTLLTATPSPAFCFLHVLLNYHLHLLYAFCQLLLLEALRWLLYAARCSLSLFLFLSIFLSHISTIISFSSLVTRSYFDAKRFNLNLLCVFLWRPISSPHLIRTEMETRWKFVAGYTRTECEN